MNRCFRLGLGVVTLSWVVAVGCGDDDDDDMDGTSGSGGTSGSAGSSNGGSAAEAGDEPTAGNDSAGGGGAAGAGAGGAPASAVECTALGRLCHDADTGAGPAHECHELGHVGDPALCIAGFGDCVRLCVAPAGEGGAGGGGAGGAGGASGEGGAGGVGPLPSPYCQALEALCGDVDDVDGPLHECHDVGVDGDAVACDERFDDCATQCIAAADAAGL